MHEVPRRAIHTVCISCRIQRATIAAHTQKEEVNKIPLVVGRGLDTSPSKARVHDIYANEINVREARDGKEGHIVPDDGE